MKPLFIFEIANNHNGDVKKGLEIIKQLAEIKKEFDYDFAIKFQYRDLNTFIHKDADKELKYVKRFNETRLKALELFALKEKAKKLGFKIICTPFDENSVDLIDAHDYDYIKIASCSLTDWSLLEAIAKLDKPVIASTASSSLEEIKQVDLFFKHRNKDLTLMHCIGEYPTSFAKLHMNRIDTLKETFPQLKIGYSGHEETYNYAAVQLAIAKGCTVFERHVDLVGSCNKYSLAMAEVSDWLYSASQAFSLCGSNELIKDNKLNGLKRGAFANRLIKKGEKITREDIYYAIPSIEGQILANDMSRYTEIIIQSDIEPDKNIMFKDCSIRNTNNLLHGYFKEITDMLTESGIAVPKDVQLELSHHEGIDRFRQVGVAIIDCINREYCKKLLILLPYQYHPKHYHVLKEETFHILSGSLTLRLMDESIELKKGDMYTITRKMKHGFSSSEGCIFEEVSTTHYKEDSFYTMELSKDRKTRMELRLYDEC